MLHAPVVSDAKGLTKTSQAPDYQLIRRAIAFLSETWTEQPSLERLAQHLGLSPAHCQKLFKRWCGLSPKEFVQAITIDRARNLCRDPRACWRRPTRSAFRARDVCTICSCRTKP